MTDGDDETNSGGDEQPPDFPAEPTQAAPEEPQLPGIKFLLETFNTKRFEALPDEDPPDAGETE